jgi:hypothetical protein
MNIVSKVAWLVSPLALMAACSGSDGEKAPCTLTVAWGTGGAAAFVPARTGGTVPVTVGAAGASIAATVQLAGGSDAHVTLTATITPDGYEPTVVVTPPAAVVESPDGHGYIDALELPLANVSPTEMPGRSAVVMVRAQGAQCEGWTTTKVSLAPQAP